MTGGTGGTVFQRVSRRARVLSGPLRPLPRWLQVVAGLVAVALGVLLVTRPLDSLTVLGVYIGVSCLASGVGDLTARTTASGFRPVVTAVVWMVAGILVLAWVGRRVDLLGPFVAGLLVVSGAARLLDLRFGVTAERVVSGLFGLSEAAFGVAALLWPDATLLVVAILFGMRCVVFGVSLLWRGIRDRPARAGRGSTARDGRPTVTQWVAAGLVVVAAVGTLVVSHAFRQGTPVVDRFYDAPSAVPGTPGQLLRSEPYAGNLPTGMTAYRILYTTTSDAGVPALASGVVAVPSAATGPVPLVAWAHGTNGVARACAPSLGPDAVPAQDVTPLGSLVGNGWGVVATDYTGEGTAGPYPYLIGQGEGRSVLDSIRAAHQLPGLRLAPQTVVWGHSQGGHAALWAGQLAPTYAPELQIEGIAALSPASDPLALSVSVVDHPGGLGASLAISFVVTAYARTYPDITLDATVVPSARTFVKEAAARCTTSPGTLVTILAGVALAQDPLLKVDPTSGVFAQRLSGNTPLGPWPAPVFIGQGSADEVVSPTVQAAYVAGRCAAGRPLRFTSYPGGTHMGVLAAGSALPTDLESWTQDRFAGRPAPNTCPSS